MKVKLIVAKAANDVIGKDNDLIWHLPADMRFFTETTRNHIVIMGRKNWDSIPDKYRPLKDRINVVVTRNKAFTDPDCEVFHSIESAIAHFKNNTDYANQDIFIIGGGQIYKYSIDHELVDEMLITHIEESFDGDTYFPDFDESAWKKHLLLHCPKNDKNPYEFTVYRYLKQD